MQVSWDRHEEDLDKEHKGVLDACKGISDSQAFHLLQREEKLSDLRKRTRGCFDKFLNI